MQLALLSRCSLQDQLGISTAILVILDDRVEWSIRQPKVPFCSVYPGNRAPTSHIDGSTWSGIWMATKYHIGFFQQGKRSSVSASHCLFADIGEVIALRMLK